MIFRPVLYRPNFGRVLTIGVIVMALYSIATFFVADNAAEVLRYGWTIAFIVALVAALFWFPSIHVQEHEVTVRNVFRTVHIPWPAIERVDTKFALTIYTPRGAVAVWASPAPSRYSVLSLTPGDTREVAQSARGAEGSIRPGDALTSESGAVANIIRRRWEQLRDDGQLENPQIEDGAFRTVTHVKTIAVLSLLLVASVLGIAL